jgi:hypothetical protein
MLQGNTFWRVWLSSVAIETQQYFIFCIVVELLVSLSKMQPVITSSCKLSEFFPISMKLECPGYTSV